MRQFPSHRLLTPADKAAVDAVLFHQFIVCAALNDSSLVHHKDLICVAAAGGLGGPGGGLRLD